MNGMITVEDALARVLASAAAPLDAERVPLSAAHGRTLASDVVALRTQPPFPNSAMD
ncbi:MAG TPA: molybdopterin molybdenumtransferase MoeA, partial [Roseiarcus sp.]|nr:molybdopterin molybdenumtransferase MoeA [Roseiarcus sp.]